MKKITIFSADEIHDLASGKIVETKDGYDGCTHLYMNAMRYATYVKSNENGDANALADLTSDTRVWNPCYYEIGRAHV